MINGELVIAYAWWEGQTTFQQILSSNNWPTETTLTTFWRVRNIGDETAIFKASFMELESVGVELDPEEETDIYLYPVTPVAGTSSYTMKVIADDEVVAEYPIGVITAVAVPTGDISVLLSSIMPLIMIVLVMQMLKPLMKGMGG